MPAPQIKRILPRACASKQAFGNGRQAVAEDNDSVFNAERHAEQSRTVVAVSATCVSSLSMHVDAAAEASRTKGIMVGVPGLASTKSP